jgi:hypothetical protein
MQSANKFLRLSANEIVHVRARTQTPAMLKAIFRLRHSGRRSARIKERDIAHDASVLRMGS